MPNNTVYNNRASSNIVYLYGNTINNGDDCDCCCYGYVPNRKDLGFISDPQEMDIVFIGNGTNGGIS